MKPDFLLLIYLFISMAINLGLLLKIFLNPKKQVIKRVDQDAKAIMMDLMAGDAYIRVTRIPPEDFIIRSPRDIK